MTWASFPQVSQPGQACVCPPASTVDSRHSHTRDDLISYPLPSAADSLSFLPRTISAYVCEKVANEVRRSRRRREQSDRRSTEGDRAGCKTRPHHLAPRPRDERDGPAACKEGPPLTHGAHRLIVPRAEDDDDVCVQVGGGRAREVQCKTGTMEEVGTSASDGGRERQVKSGGRLN